MDGSLPHLIHRLRDFIRKYSKQGLMKVLKLLRKKYFLLQKKKKNVLCKRKICYYGKCVRWEKATFFNSEKIFCILRLGTDSVKSIIIVRDEFLANLIAMADKILGIIISW